MNTIDPGPPPPTLRLHIRRSVFAAAVAATALHPDTLASVATIHFENAVFQPTRGLELTNTGRVAIAFPDARTLQIAVPPHRCRLVRGQRVAVFSPSVTILHHLGVRLDEPAIALVGELTHTKSLGELSVQVSGRTGLSVLSPAATSLPFAVPVPAPAPTTRPAPSTSPPDSSAPRPSRPPLPARLVRRRQPRRLDPA